MKRLFTALALLLPFCMKAQDPGDVLFAADSVHKIELFFSQPGFWDSLTANYTLDQMMMGDVRIDGTLLDSVGVQLKGNSSYNSYPGEKKSMKIDLEQYTSANTYDGLKKFNLNNGFKDPTMLREKLMLDFCQDHGIPAPRCGYARVYINNVYWGLYTLVEQVGKPFLQDRFGNDGGNLFKGDPTGDLRWFGNMASAYYNKYELKTNETLNDWSDLVHFLSNLNNVGGPPNFDDSLEVVLDTDLAIRAWAANILFVNLDSYQGSGHNYYIYHDAGGLFKWIIWDVNEAFGNFNMGMTLTQLKNLSAYYTPQPSGNRPLMTKMLLDPDYKASLTQYLCEWTQHDFSNAALDPKIDSLAAEIQTWYFADTNKMFPNNNFQQNISNDLGQTPGLKPFITARKTFLDGELAANGCVALGSERETAQENALRVSPNPFGDSFRIGNAEGILCIRLFDLSGREIFRTENPGGSLAPQLPGPGLYLLQAEYASGRSASLKLIRY